MGKARVFLARVHVIAAFIDDVATASTPRPCSCHDHTTPTSPPSIRRWLFQREDMGRGPIPIPARMGGGVGGGVFTIGIAEEGKSARHWRQLHGECVTVCCCGGSLAVGFFLVRHVIAELPHCNLIACSHQPIPCASPCESGTGPGPDAVERHGIRDIKRANQPRRALVKTTPAHSPRFFRGPYGTGWPNMVRW